MEKIVVEYDYGDYEYCGTDTICLLYESAESFSSHLKEAALKYIEDCRKYNELNSIWYEKYNKLNVDLKHAKKKNVQERIKQRIDDLNRDRLVYPNDEIFLNNKKISLRIFFEGNDYHPPRVKTLEDWFEERKNDE